MIPCSFHIIICSRCVGCAWIIHRHWIGYVISNILGLTEAEEVSEASNKDAGGHREELQMVINSDWSKKMTPAKIWLVLNELQIIQRVNIGLIKISQLNRNGAKIPWWSIENSIFFCESLKIFWYFYVCIQLHWKALHCCLFFFFFFFFSLSLLIVFSFF